MPLLFDQEKNNIAECAEGVAPSTAQRQPLHHKSRETERARETSIQTEQPREESKREQ